MTMQPMTARELFALDIPPADAWARYGMYRHLPEVDEYDTDWEAAERMTVREVGHIDEGDSVRYWALDLVLFDDRPVMITQTAGRSGKDHQERFIVDSQAYADLVCYLFTVRRDNARPNDLIDMDTPLPELTSFYNHSLDEATPRWKSA
jgi:hypothetical protein